MVVKKFFFTRAETALWAFALILTSVYFYRLATPSSYFLPCAESLCIYFYASKAEAQCPGFDQLEASKLALVIRRITAEWVTAVVIFSILYLFYSQMNLTLWVFQDASRLVKEPLSL